MLLLDQTMDAPPAADGVETQSAGLLLRRGDVVERFIALPFGKTTLGSGPRCTIRLQEPDVQPMQCVVTRDDRATIVRNWAGQTLLNGNPFGESAAKVGDRLSLGGCELEFVGEADAFQPATAEGAPSQNEYTPAVAVQCDHAHEFEQLRERARANRKLAGFRGRKLTKALRHERQERLRLTEQMQQMIEAHDRLFAQIEQLVQENERMSAELAAAPPAAPPTEIEARREWPRLPEPGWALGETGQDARQAGFEWYAPAEAAAVDAAAIDAIVEPSAGEPEAIEAAAVEAAFVEPAAVESTPADVQHVDDVPAEEAPKLDSSVPVPAADFSDSKPVEAAESEPTANATERQHEFEPAPEHFAEESFNSAAEGVAESFTPPIDESSSAGCERQFEVSAKSVAEPTGNSDTPATERQSQPISFIERFSHLVEGEADTGLQSRTEEPAADRGLHDDAAPTRATGLTNHGGAASGHSEEESIEEYMAKLMQRVRGEISVIPPAKGSQSGPQSAPNSRNERDGDGPLPQVQSLTPVSELSNNDPLQLTGRLGGEPRRPSTLERPASIQALREIANETARRAIAVHATSTHRQAALTKVIVSMLAAMTGLWIMLLAPAWIDLQCVAALVLLMIATYWSYQTSQSYLESIRAGNYRGLEAELELDVDAGVREVSLPIDVERDQW